MSEQELIDRDNAAKELAAKYGTTYWAAYNKKDDPYFQRANANDVYEDGVTIKQPYYKQIAAKRGMPLKPGTNLKTQEPYERRFRFGDGGEELMRIVAGLQRGVHQINGTQTVNDANDWLTRNKKDNWEVIQGDFTGPNGIPDGIPEVIVTDAKGNVRIVNGYALGPSSYGWRRAYYETVPEEERPEFTYGQFKDEYKRIERGLKDGEFYYKNELTGKLANVRGKISARNLFRQVFFTPTFKLFKGLFPPDLRGMDLSQISTQIFKYVWNMLFLYPTMVIKDGSIDENTILEMEPKKFEQLKKSNGVKEAIKDRMKTILNDTAQQVMLFVRVASAICIILENLYNARLDRNATIYNIKIGTLLNANAVEAFCGDDSNVNGMVSQIDAQDEGINDYYAAIRTKQTNKWTERKPKIARSRALLANTPMYYKDISDAAMAAGWRYDQGLYNENEDVWAPARQMFNDAERPDIPELPRQQAPQRQTPVITRPAGGGLSFGNSLLKKTPPKSTNTSTSGAGNRTGFGTGNSTSKYGYSFGTKKQQPAPNPAQQAAAKEVAQQLGMGVVTPKNVTDANKASPTKKQTILVQGESEPETAQ